MTEQQRQAGTKRPTLGRQVVGVVGLGLIGGSVAKRLAAGGVAAVCGYDADPRRAQDAGQMVTWSPDLATLVPACDSLVLCVPVPVIVQLLPAIAAATRHRTRRGRLLVVDMGSTKLAVARAAARFRRHFDYIGLHPLAGGETNGWSASTPDLYEGRTVIYCPGERDATQTARRLIRVLGGVPVAMDAKTHDRAAAETIGLPHMLAFAAAALRPPARAPHPLRGTSWSGLTRVSVSDPAFVAGLLVSNRPNQLAVLRTFRRELDRLTSALDRGDTASLVAALGRATRRQGPGSTR